MVIPNNKRKIDDIEIDDIDMIAKYVKYLKDTPYSNLENNICKKNKQYLIRNRMSIANILDVKKYYKKKIFLPELFTIDNKGKYKFIDLYDPSKPILPPPKGLISTLAIINYIPYYRFKEISS